MSWSGIPAPTNADGIALYVNAPGTTVNGLSPLKWQWANKSPGYALAGGGFSSSGSLVCAAPLLAYNSGVSRSSVTCKLGPFCSIIASHKVGFLWELRGVGGAPVPCGCHNPLGGSPS